MSFKDSFVCACPYQEDDPGRDAGPRGGKESIESEEFFCDNVWTDKIIQLQSFLPGSGHRRRQREECPAGGNGGVGRV